MHVNSAMYDATQEASSGAHIELTTKSGTNDLHGGAYDYYQTSKWNANQWFFGHNSLARPPMRREVFGGYAGAPIIKDKLFVFGSYQGQRVNDELLASSLVAVPPHLTNDRSAQGVVNAVNADFGTSIRPDQVTSQALDLLQEKAPGGSYPSDFRALCTSPRPPQRSVHAICRIFEAVEQTCRKVYLLDKDHGFTGRGMSDAFEFTTQRLAAGSQMLLNLWYSAWLDSASYTDRPPLPQKPPQS